MCLAAPVLYLGFSGLRSGEQSVVEPDQSLAGNNKRYGDHAGGYVSADMVAGCGNHE
jgi:hypothetical protein